MMAKSAHGARKRGPRQREPRVVRRMRAAARSRWAGEDKRLEDLLAVTEFAGGARHERDDRRVV